MQLHLYSLRLTEDGDIFTENTIEAADFVETEEGWNSESIGATLKKGPFVISAEEAGDVVVEMTSRNSVINAERLLKNVVTPVSGCLCGVC